MPASRSRTSSSGRTGSSRRALLEDLYREWSERDERTAAYAIWYLGLVEFFAGRFAGRGRATPSRPEALSAQYARDEAEAPQSLYPLALVAAHLGELERARELGDGGLRLVELHGSRLERPDGDARRRRAVER